eukprot:TRINITY_DN35822_c1_g1_i5.p2 TRINITY_DN35822_c1_g1~~TRINITY_DN35822_c1_g1_i5.p2  ORF type:complete len:190 (-),score=33.46 TRINITY_DN35822_c1_g1_i5:92-628(-)
MLGAIQVRQSIRPTIKSTPLQQDKLCLKNFGRPCLIRSAGPEQDSATPVAAEPEIESVSDEKKRIADELRAQEEFMVVNKGEAECVNCQYTYKPADGDPNFPIAKGTLFEDIPEDWQCPGCGSPKSTFKLTRKVVAGFAANQGYGLGTNAWTGDQKLLVIYGSLLFFFALFISGYFLD